MSNVVPFPSPGGYSPATIVTSSTDRRGHYDRIEVKVPPEWKGEIAAIIEGNKVPDLRTFNDFVRDAMFHRLHYYQAMIGPAMPVEWQAAVQQLLDQVMSDRIYQRAQRMEERYSQHEARVKELLLRGDDEPIRKYVIAMEKEAINVPEERMRERMLNLARRARAECLFLGGEA